jgi:hypothetical protein
MSKLDNAKSATTNKPERQLPIDSFLFMESLNTKVVVQMGSQDCFLQGALAGLVQR